jgi:hypothetical protein
MPWTLRNVKLVAAHVAAAEEDQWPLLLLMR